MISEKTAVREAIKKLPVVTFPVVTESGKAAIEKDGSQQKQDFDLSRLTASIGNILNKYGNTDIYFYVSGSIVKLPKGTIFGNRTKAFVKALVSAVFKKPSELTVKVCTALRDKYDFPLINEAGQFIATEATVLEGIRIHETAKSQYNSLDVKFTRRFGCNPMKLELIKDCREAGKAMKDGNFEAAYKAAAKVKGSEAVKLIGN